MSEYVISIFIPKKKPTPLVGNPRNMMKKKKKFK